MPARPSRRRECRRRDRRRHAARRGSRRGTWHRCRGSARPAGRRARERRSICRCPTVRRGQRRRRSRHRGKSGNPARSQNPRIRARPTTPAHRVSTWLRASTRERSPRPASRATAADRDAAPQHPADTGGRAALRGRSVSTWASSRSTRGIAPGTAISVAQSSGTSVIPISRAAYAGNSAVRSGVAVNTTLIRSSLVRSLRSSIARTSSEAAARIWSRSLSSTWIAPRTARTATSAPRGRPIACRVRAAAHAAVGLDACRLIDKITRSICRLSR